MFLDLTENIVIIIIYMCNLGRDMKTKEIKQNVEFKSTKLEKNFN